MKNKLFWLYYKFDNWWALFYCKINKWLKLSFYYLYFILMSVILMIIWYHYETIKKQQHNPDLGNFQLKMSAKQEWTLKKLYNLFLKTKSSLRKLELQRVNYQLCISLLNELADPHSIMAHLTNQAIFIHLLDSQGWHDSKRIYACCLHLWVIFQCIMIQMAWMSIAGYASKEYFPIATLPTI